MRPPRFARAWLRRALPLDVREHIAGDLEERFMRDVGSAGPSAARWRYRRAAASFSFRFALERLRESLRSIAGVRLSALDLRLGVRMLVRYPLLTVVGSVALSLAIAIGASVFAFISLLLWPTVPLPEGERVVRVKLYDGLASGFDDRVSADLIRWQQHASSLVNIGAGRGFRRNLTTADGFTDLVAAAEVTASTFDLVRLKPVIGRVLTEADAEAAAPPVMVIGHALWLARFDGKSDAVGQSVMLGETPTTIVGVMPDEMRFPSIHQAWIPLRFSEARIGPGAGAGLMVWARLSPGISLARAQAEMTTIGLAPRPDRPANPSLRLDVLPFASADQFSNPTDRMLLGSINLAVVLLIVLISGNVALLMFARAATRENEILVRTALGASRGRVITQFFSEALVLSGLAAVLGLGLATAGLRWGIEAFAMSANDGQPLPFWFSRTLPRLSIAYGVGLALLSALVTGVLPALKVTRGLQSRLRQSTAGGGGLKFGGVWTVLIVAQVALTVTFPAVTYFVKRDGWQIESTNIGVPPAEFLTARLSRDRDVSTARYVTAVREVREGIAAVPGVSHATLADRLPLMWNGMFLVDVEEGGSSEVKKHFDAYAISRAAVDVDFFSTFNATPRAGRFFNASDYAGPPRTAIVNESFVATVLGGLNPLGRRVRAHVQNPDAQVKPQPWLEIIGVVRDLGMAVAPDPKVAGMYVPLTFQDTSAVYVSARVSGDQAAAASALRRLAQQVDVTLRVTEVQSLDLVTANALREVNFWTTLTGGVSLATLMLSLTGIYAVMSFAVARRTREIGIRIALGSDRYKVVLAVLRSPLQQLAGGIVAGAILTAILSGQIVTTLAYQLAVAGYALVMFGVCLLACLVPARRALRVNPVDALRAE
jgi:putative ABC transport system permease protein